MKLLLDTDIGTDIDDCACLAYLLCEPKCELLGITTVTGEPDKRARIGSALCMAMGRDDIPIYPGAAEPLLIPQYQAFATQAGAIGDRPHRTEFPKGEAISFLRGTIRRHPGEITLLTIGPLTNIGLLFAMDPEIPLLLHSFVMMGGVFDSPPEGYGETEWNMRGDPHASAIAYRCPAPVHRAVGLDVTSQLWMDAKTLKLRFQGPLLGAVREIGWSSVERYGGMVFHDPLAATVFDPTLCRFEQGTISVEIEGPAHGRAHFTPEETGAHEAAMAVDTERFFDHYFAVFV